MAGMLDFLTGGSSGEATDAQKKAIAELQGVQAPTQQQLTLPELQQYAIAQNMSPAQMQAFLQQNNALNGPVDQAGTSAQKQAISQLANVANAGAEGTPQEKAQVSQIMQDTGRNLAGQRGAIEQQAQARGVPVGMLQAALSSQNAGQDLQTANQGALQAQGQAYQQAVNAMAQGGGLGAQLQGQQNTQANTVGQAQNAMQQFNAANQQNASQNNASNQQQANMQNTQNANQVSQANTGLANQRTSYNAALPQQVFNNQMQKAGGIANQYNNAANTATGQGQQQAGLMGGILGAGATIAGGMMGGPVGAAVGKTAADQLQQKAHGGVIQPYARGGAVPDPDELRRQMMMLQGSTPMRQGGMVPGHAMHPGDSLQNDKVHAMLSPGEAVVPRTAVQQNPAMVQQLLGRGQPPVPPQGHHPQDVAALLAAMKHMRGAQ